MLKKSHPKHPISFYIIYITFLIFGVTSLVIQPQLITLTDYFLIVALIGELFIYGFSFLTYRRIGMRIARIKLKSPNELSNKKAQYSPITPHHPQYLRLFKNRIKWLRERVKTLSKLWFVITAEILIGLILAFVKGEISMPSLPFIFAVLICFELLAFISDIYNLLSAMAEERLVLHGF